MRIVMTGGTSGFGRHAAERLARDGHVLTIGARSTQTDAEQHPITYLPLDLDQPSSVDRFAEAVREGPAIDALVLNAGLQLSTLQLTQDGIERTFFVNHLAHALLLYRLLPAMAPGGRIVLTGSGTHDPEERTPVTPPVHADARLLAYPHEDPSLPKGNRQQAFRAYSSSKLANIMTARHLAKLYPTLSVLAYDPGYVPWTGLGRANGRVIAALASLIVPRLMAKDRSSTIPLSGRYLAELASSPAYVAERGSYWSVRTPDLLRMEPSQLARDDAAAAKLWEDSLALLGLT
jgi:NAD(P)-dependent dehydrogenase (short-subunit alcohol dehydrogenase family)